MRTVKLWAVVLMPWLVLTGCGAGDSMGSGTGSSSGGTTSASGAGIWVGTDSASGLSLTGIIDAGGLATFIRSDGTQYTGTAQLSGTTLSIALDVYTQFGTHFSDGSDYGVGMLSATLSNGTTLSGSVNFTTSANSTVSSTWSLSFSTLYNTASSLADITGNYTDASSPNPLTSTTVSITAVGEMTAQSGTTGCVLNGQVSTIDTSHDAYLITYHLDNCSGSYAALNTVAFSGLALLNTTQSPATFILAVKGQNASDANFGVASNLTLN